MQIARTSVPKGPPDTSKKMSAIKGSRVSGFFLQHKNQAVTEQQKNCAAAYCCVCVCKVQLSAQSNIQPGELWMHMALFTDTAGCHI